MLAVSLVAWRGHVTVVMWGYEKVVKKVDVSAHD